MPQYGREFPLLHALSLVDGYLSGENAYPEIVVVRAGGSLECGRLLRWINQGNMGLGSAVASPVMVLLERIMGSVKCPIVVTSTEGGWYDTEESDILDDPQSFISNTRRRTISRFLQKGMWGWLKRLPRIPLTGEEVKSRLQLKYELDEKKAIRMLADIGSVSCGIYSSWNLNREVISRALKLLCFSRKCQTMLSSVICATRFKFLEEGRRIPTRCRNPNCIQPGCFDDIRHLLLCHDLKLPQEGDEEMIEFLTLLATKTTVGNPGIPTPAAMHYELELDLEDATELIESHFAWIEAEGKGTTRGGSGAGESGAVEQRGMGTH